MRPCHPTDVAKLIDVPHRIVDDGHTVIVIEHNLDVIAEAGQLTATGTPEQIAAHRISRTAPFLAGALKQLTSIHQKPISSSTPAQGKPTKKAKQSKEIHSSNL